MPFRPIKLCQFHFLVVDKLDEKQASDKKDEENESAFDGEY